ncbi:MAG: hypothetical protein WCF19_03130 [Chlamydiales bacterium]
MKKCALLVAVSAALSAAPVGNTSAPEIIQQGLCIPSDSWIAFRVGYEGDFVADGKMELTGPGSGRVDTYEQWTNSGTFTFNILDRLDVYGVFGASKTHADWRYQSADGWVNRIQFGTDNQFLWAAGSRAILYQWGHTFLGVGGRYSSCSGAPAWLKANGSHASVAGSQFHWREWQINLDISYTIHLFTPYIGTKYSNARTRLVDFSVPVSANGGGNTAFKNRTPVGLYLGCALSSGNYLMINLEGRLIDEEAVTVSADFRF